MSSEATVAAAAASKPDQTVGVGSVQSERTNEVWHVRHGERCDEVRGEEQQAWERSPRCKAGGWFDPFLTRDGHVQACRAGEHLKGLPFNRQQKQPGSFDVVYTSPLVRAVQTAVCISQSLGNLPLQVVPGLCSCTAALSQIGYSSAEATLMTDKDIIEAFPGVNVVPTDPLAPTSFEGATEWLTAKACEKKAAGSDGDGECFSRVLAVGHREGTKEMARKNVPTPYCCIGIFKVKAAEENLYPYELHDLLTNTGESLKSSGGSAYARPKVATSEEENRPRNEDEDGDGEVEALAARIAALSDNMKGPKICPPGTGVQDAALGETREAPDSEMEPGGQGGHGHDTQQQGTQGVELPLGVSAG
ncbi:unnamed protein product [Ectocarpus sp. 4 AP-2014]